MFRMLTLSHLWFPHPFLPSLGQSRSNLCFLACVRQNSTPNKSLKSDNNKQVPKKKICKGSRADQSSFYSWRTSCCCWIWYELHCSGNCLGSVNCTEVCAWCEWNQHLQQQNICVCIWAAGTLSKSVKFRHSLIPQKIGQIQKSWTKSSLSWQSNGLEGKRIAGCHCV